MKKRIPPTKPKTPQELRDTKRAISITGKVLRELEPFNRTEKEVAREIRKRIHSQGARLSFKPIVSTGSNTRFVHHKPGNRIIRKKDPLMIDLGAKYRGQCSDITRMYIPPSKRIKRVHQSVLAIQKGAFKMLRPGRKFKELSEFYKKALKKKRYKAKHSIGHGLGAHIHERIGELKPGMVLTLEPGIYLKKFGCRTEDMFLIKSRGTEILSKGIPKEL